MQEELVPSMHEYLLYALIDRDRHGGRGGIIMTYLLSAHNSTDMQMHRS